VDTVQHTERRFYGMFGSHSRWGPFTIAGGIGLGVELNKQERCFPDGATGVASATDQGCDGALEIALERNLTTRGDLNGGLHPIYIEGRFSLGFVF
jgi:hypothetical protein